MDVSELLDHIVSSQAKRQQEAASVDEMDKMLREVLVATKGLTPIVVKIVQTMAVLRAADQQSAMAVQELRQVAEEHS